MARTELSFTQGGSPSYEAGAALGGPIVNDKLGFRVSGWYRHDGGYIDRVDPFNLKTVQAAEDCRSPKSTWHAPGSGYRRYRYRSWSDRRTS